MLTPSLLAGAPGQVEDKVAGTEAGERSTGVLSDAHAPSCYSSGDRKRTVCPSA